VLLMLHWLLCPCVSIFLTRSLLWSCILTFLQVTALWGINYIAAEIESPFGRDANDLDLEEMAHDMNDSLFLLLERHTQQPPKLDISSMQPLKKRQTSERRITTFKKSSSDVTRPDALQKAMTRSYGADEFFVEQPKDLEECSISPPASPAQPREPNPLASALVADVILNAVPPVLAACDSQVQTQNLLSGALQMDNVEKMLTSLIAELVELRVARLRSNCEIEDFNPPRTTLLQQAKKKLLAEGTSPQQQACTALTPTPNSSHVLFSSDS